MELAVFLVAIALSGLIVGAMARLAVPGPDPLSLWKTITLGIIGSLIGGIAAHALGFEAGRFVFALIGAVLVLIAYRRWVQGRTLTGPRSR